MQSLPAGALSCSPDDNCGGAWSVDHCDTVAVAPKLTACRAQLRHRWTPDHRPGNPGGERTQSQQQQRRQQQRSEVHGDW
jgi:hypothetical protein